MHPIDAILLIVLAMLFVIETVSAIAAARLPMRVMRLPCSPVENLHEGATQIVGELVAVSGHAATWDGAPAIIVETGPAGWGSNFSVDRSWAQAELRSGASSCRVDLDGVILIGERRLFHVDAEQLRVRHPPVHARLASTVVKVRGVRVIPSTDEIEQRVLPAGAAGFVAGEVMRMRVEKEGYRGAIAEQWVVASAPGMPLIVSTRPKPEVVRCLFGPAMLHAAVALLAAILAIALLAADRWIAAAASP